MTLKLLATPNRSPDEKLIPFVVPPDNCERELLRVIERQDSQPVPRLRYGSQRFGHGLRYGAVLVRTIVFDGSRPPGMGQGDCVRLYARGDR